MNINPIVRIVIEKEGYVLLTTPTNLNKRFDKNSHFLPGGHVEYLESSLEALERELIEELLEPSGIEITGFLGILECTWDNKMSGYHELNIVYRGTIENLDVNNPPKSKEDHIQFKWVKLDEIKNVNILPGTFGRLIPEWLRLEVDKYTRIDYEMAVTKVSSNTNL